MVRYDKCVESLYDTALVDDRSKTLQILKVMKGAISMSKSRTGQCIFRTNKTVKKDLERLVNIEERNNSYNISRIDTSKKFVVGRWSRILENQTSCSSQTLFEEVLDISLPGANPPTDKEDPKKLKSLIDVRLEKLASYTNNSGFPGRRGSTSTRQLDRQQTKDSLNIPSGDGNPDHANDVHFVTERKELRQKYAGNGGLNVGQGHSPRNQGHSPRYQGQGQGHSTSQSQDADVGESKVGKATLSKSYTQPLVLPPISGFRREFTYSPQTQHKEPEHVEHRPVLERDLTDWSNWALKDKTWINGYLHREKTKHEDLVIRNALVKIEQEMSGANMIKRHQLRQKLQNDKNQRDIDERKKVRRRRDLEKSREILNIQTPSELLVQPLSPKPREKHVEFADTLVEILEAQEEPKKKQTAPVCRKVTHKATNKHASDSVTPLPVITEDIVTELPVIVEDTVTELPAVISENTVCIQSETLAT